jgi:hypothetical protein
VRVERRTLPAEWPAGPRSTSSSAPSSSTTGTEPTLERGARRHRRRRWRPAGAWSRSTTARRRASIRSTGDVVHALLRERLALAHVESEVNDAFRLDVFDA